MFYPVYWPRLVQKFLLPNAWCHYQNDTPTLYLTFDDGPIPKVTPWVLQLLEQYNAKATFFCVGENVERYYAIYQQLLEQGHAVGNHTQYHNNGWTTKTARYLESVALAQKQINSPLFRPPYGRLTIQQSRFLRRQGYQLVYWEVLAGDFDRSITWEKCLQNIISNAREGSIVVLHDSEKAWGHLREVLPRVLEHYHQMGYQFLSLPKPTV